MKPKEYWGDPEIAKDWIKTAKIYASGGDNSDEVVVKKIGKKFKTVLEVGSGNGRIIGKLSETYKDVECHAYDINEELLEYIEKKYIGVGIHPGEIIDLPFEDNSFDLVYTFQVLQHVVPEEIEKALSELQRVAKKEVWLFEGWGDIEKMGVPNGHMRHKAKGGTFYWDFENMVDCYDVRHLNRLKKGEVKDTGIKCYKIKVKKTK